MCGSSWNCNQKQKTMNIELKEITVKELTENYQDNAENGVVGLAVKNGNAKWFAFSGTPDSNLFSDISKNLGHTWNGKGDKK